MAGLTLIKSLRRRKLLINAALVFFLAQSGSGLHVGRVLQAGCVRPAVGDPVLIRGGIAPLRVSHFFPSRRAGTPFCGRGRACVATASPLHGLATHDLSNDLPESELHASCTADCTG